MTYILSHLFKHQFILFTRFKFMDSTTAIATIQPEFIKFNKQSYTNTFLKKIILDENSNLPKSFN